VATQQLYIVVTLVTSTIFFQFSNLTMAGFTSYDGSKMCAMLQETPEARCRHGFIRGECGLHSTCRYSASECRLQSTLMITVSTTCFPASPGRIAPSWSRRKM